VAGAVVGIAHILLIQLEDRLGLALDPAEQGQELRKIGLAHDRSGLRDERAVEHGTILAVQVLQVGGHRSFVSQSDIVELGLEGSLE